MKVFILMFMLFAVFAPIAAFSQDASRVNDNVAEITGQIERFSEEGGFYGIQGDDGNVYRPEELDDEYRRAGLKVKAKVRKLDRKLLIGAWAVPVDILEIERER